MSAYAVPTTAESCVQEFVRRLNVRITNTTTYQLFMPLLTELIEQSTGRIDMNRVNRILGELSSTALAAGAEPISYLRTHWGAGLATTPATSRSAVPRAATPVTSTTARTPSTPPVSPPPTPSASAPAPTPSVSAAATPDRALIRDAAEASGGTVAFSWAQSSLFDSLGIPRDTFNGFCALAVGEFLVRPDTIRTKLTTTRGKVDLINAHGRYRGSGKPSYEFITGEFGLTYVGATEVAALTPENTLRALESLRGTRHMIGVTKTAGGGHAVGVIVSGGKYTFFDAEEGQCELANRDSFWRFLHRYITHTTKGLATDYQRVFVATWS